MQSINNRNVDGKVPLCFRISDVDGYFIEENENKYLVFVLTENTKNEMELYKQLWSKIKKQIKTLNSGESIKYKNDFMKIRLDSYDDVPLNKILYFPVLDIIVESVFQIENYPQIDTDECEYECE